MAMETNITEQINDELMSSIENMKKACVNLIIGIKELREYKFDIESITGKFYTEELGEVIEDIAGDFDYLRGLINQAEDAIEDDDSICSLLISEDGEDIIEGMRKENEEFYYSLGSPEEMWEYLTDYDYMAIPDNIEEYWDKLEAKAIQKHWKRG